MAATGAVRFAVRRSRAWRAPTNQGMEKDMTNTNPCTRAVRAGIETDTQHGAVVPPLHLSTYYSFAGFN